MHENSSKTRVCEHRQAMEERETSTEKGRLEPHLRPFEEAEHDTQQHATSI